jgi:4-carboxymuconolactone decarboxylase
VVDGSGPIDDRTGDLADDLAEGFRVRREVLGDAHVDRATAAATAFGEPFQRFITEVAWGKVWTRKALDRRTRSCMTLAILATLRAEDELALHVRAAITNGLTPDEIREVLLHTAVYAGVPAANTAVGIAQRTLVEMGELGDDGATDPEGDR